SSSARRCPRLQACSSPATTPTLNIRRRWKPQSAAACAPLGDCSRHTMGTPMNDAADHRLTVLEARLDRILATLATKSDVSEAKASLVMLGSIVAASTAIVIALLLFAINRAAG